MPEASVRLIIENGPVTPGILRVLTDSDEYKLSEIWNRLESLSGTLRFVVAGAEVEYADEAQAKRDLVRAVEHVRNSLDDICAIAGGFATRERAA